LKLDDATLEKLADEDDVPDFVCPDCNGAFFTLRWGQDVYECDTITDSFRCTWKGPASACLLPSRASLAKEILALRKEGPNAEVLRAALAVGRARLDHDAAKSDPLRHVATGQSVYAAEVHFDRVVREALTEPMK
jgi:hypothetical protein